MATLVGTPCILREGGSWQSYSTGLSFVAIEAGEMHGKLGAELSLEM